MNNSKKDYRNLAVLLTFLLLMIIILWALGPIAQNPAYHLFADNRTILQITNFANVASNIPFLFVGAYGFIWLAIKQKKHFLHRNEKLFYYIYFTAIFLVGIGSGYYHWVLTNYALMWDRLPITLALMSFFAAMIAERISLKVGLYLLAPLLIFGVFSIIYWYYTELAHAGDLRIYGLVQFYPVTAIPYMLVAYKNHYNKTFYIWLALALYVLAKIVEWQDNAIFYLSRYLLSGHTLKHLLSAVAAYCILLYLQKRKITAGN